jgi:hypothetical protein
LADLDTSRDGFTSMSDDSSPALNPERRKCTKCGLVNRGNDKVCRRCGEPLTLSDDAPPASYEIPASQRTTERTFVRRVAWVVSATLFILIIWYVSLLISSDSLKSDQHAQVQNAIDLIQQGGFTREAFILNHLTSFRGSDNWLNAYIGHRDAYAATNFPFEVVTLYPDFFALPIDDHERAAVLLHEARHLSGDGEEDALRFVWQNKRRIGWTADRYGQTRLWDATARMTKANFPYYFQCGANSNGDCF